jgi:hypothetical protein
MLSTNCLLSEFFGNWSHTLQVVCACEEPATGRQGHYLPVHDFALLYDEIFRILKRVVRGEVLLGLVCSARHLLVQLHKTPLVPDPSYNKATR